MKAEPTYLGVERHPIYLEVADDLERSRLTVLFRLLLALPHYLWLSLWAIPAGLAVVPQWFITLVAGRPSAVLHSFIARFVRYTTQVYAYSYLLGDPFPRFSGAAAYPIDLVVDPPEPQSRWKVAFRVVLAIPPAVFAYVLGFALQIVAFAGWFVCLVLGRMPLGMRDLGAYCLRYQQQTGAYILLLTDRYPTIASEPPREGAAAGASTPGSWGRVEAEPE